MNHNIGAEKRRCPLLPMLGLKRKAGQCQGTPGRPGYPRKDELDRGARVFNRGQAAEVKTVVQLKWTTDRRLITKPREYQYGEKGRKYRPALAFRSVGHSRVQFVWENADTRPRCHCALLLRRPASVRSQ